MEDKPQSFGPKDDRVEWRSTKHLCAAIIFNSPFMLLRPPLPFYLEFCVIVWLTYFEVKNIINN